MQHAGGQAQATAAPLLSALPIALEHPAVSTYPCNLCAVAQVCRAWRYAVQQRGACNTAVRFGPNASPQQLASFSRWLPKHASHVRSISISSEGSRWDSKQVHGLPWQGYLEVTRQLLLLAMAATAAPRQLSAAELCTSTEQQQQQQRQQQRAWRVASFSSDLPGAADLVYALPAASLTQLQLNLQHDTAVNATALSKALAQLSNLQSLCLHSHCGEEDAIPVSCLAGIAHFSQLTELQLRNCWSDFDQPLQQLLAQPLPLRKLLLHVRSDLPDLHLSHLTQLEVLEHTWGALTPQTVLPQQLRRLQLGAVECAADLNALMQLPALHWLSILVRFEQPPLLLQLAQHASLQELALVYDGCTEALATAAVWRHLPQLRELRFVWENSIPSKEQSAAILGDIAAVSGLTKLEFSAHVLTEADEEHCPAYYEPPPPEVAVCARLAASTHLRDVELYMYDARLVPGDALALTALTNLTRLVCLGDAPELPQPLRGRGVGGAEVAALARSLPQLRHLELNQCNMRDMDSMAAIGDAGAANRAASARGLRDDAAGVGAANRVDTATAADAANKLQVTDQVLKRFGLCLGVQKVLGVRALQPELTGCWHEMGPLDCEYSGEGSDSRSELLSSDGESDEWEDCNDGSDKGARGGG